ncbi:hypothetical protein GCM10009105_20360 [Dokdonella soli]|uniref:Beta-lactamase-related domain-containing protein n=2 Tax=Dokdonella soli TaxID=529810 RepID=A0ABN1IJ75_9GAMM
MKNTVKLLAAALYVLAASACTSAPDRSNTVARREQEIRSRLDRDVPNLLAAYAIPSVSIAHVEADKLVFAAAYGSQSPGIPANTKTLYNIASLSKPISAEVILQAASRGQLTLDEPMYRYWVDPDIANDERSKLLTPRLALSHQTGFPNWRSQTGRVLTFKRAPGEAFGYSGEGYEYVARFTEKRTATDFEALAQNLVFDPIGMKETAYTERPWFDGRIAAPMDAQGKALKPQLTRKWVASDMIYTTASDYARFMLSVMRGDRLAKGLANERSRVQVVERSAKCSTNQAPGCPDEAGFGLGWEVFRIGGELFLTHDGSDPGVSTFVYINLTKRNGTVILTNSANGPRIVLPILDLLGADPVFVECTRRETC